MRMMVEPEAWKFRAGTLRHFEFMSICVVHDDIYILPVKKKG